MGTRRAVGVVVLALVALGWPGGANAQKAGPVRGQVRALPDTGQARDWSLTIDGRRAAGRAGRFAIARAGARYDAWLVDKQAQVVTIYQGLTRRDPVLWGRGDGSSSREGRKATVHGILRGDFPFPIGAESGLNVYFFAKHASGFWQAHPPEWGDGVAAGPRFGRMTVAWQEGASLRGRLVALGETAAEKQRWTRAALAWGPIVLDDGAESFAEMTLENLTIGHIAGSVSIDGNDRVREIGFYYRLPDEGGRVALGGCPVLNTYDCRLPDLGRLGGEYCAHIGYQFPVRDFPNGNATRCGGKLGATDFSFRIGPHPQWTESADRMSPGGTLAWKDAGKGIYRVLLAPAWDSAIKGPVFEIYTHQTRVRWPDARAWGIHFATGATYKVEVTRMSYDSVDRVASATGFDKSGDYEEAEMSPLNVTLVSP